MSIVNSANCKIIIIGMPIIKRLCFVLCRQVCIAKNIPSEPPMIENKNKVFSLILRLCFIAKILSAKQTIAAIIFTTAR